MTKKHLIASLTIASLVIVQPVKAQDISSEQQARDSSDYSISPRQLISLANQGQFKSQGIPSRNDFRRDVKTGNITAQVLIDSAIASKRLPIDVREDRNYLETVSNHLKSGGCGT